jgi:hypothetical protein
MVYTLYENEEGRIVRGYRREWGDAQVGGREIVLLETPTQYVSGMREAYMLPHTSHWEVWDYEEDYEAQPGDWDYEEDYEAQPGDWFHVDGGDIKGNGYE